MQKQEFISLCGQYNPGVFESITDMDYRKYEALYDELDDLSKQKFCELLMTNTKQLLAEAAKDISYWRGRTEDLEEEKNTMGKALVDHGDYDTLSEVYDTKTVISIKLEHGDRLDDGELEYIRLNLK